MMTYAIKAEVAYPRLKTLVFTAQKTMYGGKGVAPGDRIYIFASENEGGKGLIASGTVSTVEAIAKQLIGKRETPRISLTVERLVYAQKPLGRNELKAFTAWTDEQPQTELNFKFYRQATNKVIAITDGTADFLESFF